MKPIQYRLYFIVRDMTDGSILASMLVKEDLPDPWVVAEPIIRVLCDSNGWEMPSLPGSEPEPEPETGGRKLETYFSRLSDGILSMLTTHRPYNTWTVKEKKESR